MRRFKQELSNEECVGLLTNEMRGVLAVLGDNGYPYTIPMDYVFVDGKLYFHSALEGHKIDAIKNNSKVSFCVLDAGVKQEGNWCYIFKSVIVFGNIKIIDDLDEKIDKLTHLGNKFFPSTKDTEEEINRL